MKIFHTKAFLTLVLVFISTTVLADVSESTEIWIMREQIKNIILCIASVAAIVGGVRIGIAFFQNNPNANQMFWNYLLAMCIILCISEIVIFITSIATAE